MIFVEFQVPPAKKLRVLYVARSGIPCNSQPRTPPEADWRLIHTRFGNATVTIL